MRAGWANLGGFPGVFEGGGAVEDGGVGLGVGVGGEVAEALELEGVAGLGVEEVGFDVGGDGLE